MQVNRLSVILGLAFLILFGSKASTASNGHIYGQIVEAYSGNDQDLKDVINEEISARAREVGFASNLV